MQNLKVKILTPIWFFILKFAICNLHLLFFQLLQPTELEPQGIEFYKTFRVGLLIPFSFFKGRHFRVVKGRGRFSPGHYGIPFIELKTHPTTDVLLRGVDGLLQYLPLRGEPVAIIDEFGILGNERVSEPHHLPIHRNRLQGTTGAMEESAPRSFVDPARLHPHVPVFHQIHPSDSVPRPQAIQTRKESRRRITSAVHCHWIPAGEVDLDILGPVRRLFYRSSPEKHIGRRLAPGALQDAPLVADMEKVAVDAIGSLFTYRD